MKRLAFLLLLAIAPVAMLGVVDKNRGGGTSTSVPVREDVADKNRGGGTSTSVPVREDVQFADKNRGGGTSTSVPVREDVV